MADQGRMMQFFGEDGQTILKDVFIDSLGHIILRKNPHQYT